MMTNDELRQQCVEAELALREALDQLTYMYGMLSVKNQIFVDPSFQRAIRKVRSSIESMAACGPQRRDDDE